MSQLVSQRVVTPSPTLASMTRTPTRDVEVTRVDIPTLTPSSSRISSAVPTVSPSARLTTSRPISSSIIPLPSSPSRVSMLPTEDSLLSPRMTTLPSSRVSLSPSTLSSPSRVTVPPSPSRVTVPPSPSRVTVPPSPSRISVPPSPSRITVPPSPSRITVPPSPSRISVPPSPSRISVPPSPSRMTPLTASIPVSTQRTGVVSSLPSASNLSARTPVMTPSGIPIPTLERSVTSDQALSSLTPTMSPSVEIMSDGFEIRDYQGIIANASIENELLNSGYVPMSRIVVQDDSGQRQTQYIKSINKKGQKVFILVDANGYTTARASDLTLVETHPVSIVPYSLKVGAYECAGTDVCGVAFECGSDAVCMLTRGKDDLSPKEATFVFVEQSAPTIGSIQTEGSVMTYPVIRLSEIRANPELVLENTDVVTRRLRNSAYQIELQELDEAQQAISRLDEAFSRFNAIRENAAMKLTRTLQQLEEWNEIYLSNPPDTDDLKDRYRRLQSNLTQRNEGISNLLRLMKRVSDKRTEIELITDEINELSDLAEREFATVEYATSD